MNTSVTPGEIELFVVGIVLFVCVLLFFVLMDWWGGFMFFLRRAVQCVGTILAAGCAAIVTHSVTGEAGLIPIGAAVLVGIIAWIVLG